MARMQVRWASTAVMRHLLGRIDIAAMNSIAAEVSSEATWNCQTLREEGLRILLLTASGFVSSNRFWLRGMGHCLQLFTRWWPHQVPVHSYNPVVVQIASGKQNISQNKTKNYESVQRVAECGSTSVWERDWLKRMTAEKDQNPSYTGMKLSGTN